MKKEIAQKLIKKGRLDYNLIANYFSQTRNYPWADFEIFKKYLKKGDRILDAGCGNGRLSEFLQKIKPKIQYTGLDSSLALLKLAKKNYPEKKFVFGDMTHLPFSDESFDMVAAIAVFQHLPGEELRVKALGEVNRVLKNGGIFIMTNWNLWQKKFRGLRIRCKLKKIFGLSKLDYNDILKPWRAPEGKILTKRYLHAYSLKEIELLLKKSGFKVIENYFSYRGKKAEKTKAFNIITIGQKVAESGNK